MGYTDLIQALRDLQPTDQEGSLAYLGFTPPGGVYTITVANQPGKVWVRIVQGDTRTVDQARNNKVPLIPDLPVRVGLSKGKPAELEVLDFDSSAWDFLGTSAPGLVAPHSHEPGYGMEDPVSPRRLKMGLVHAATPPSLSVYIEPFHYTHEGEGKYWPGGSLDLTSYCPSGVGQWSWVKVGINTATNTAVAAAGSDTSTYLPLTEAALAAIAFDGYLALAGVKLRNGQTTIANEWDFADCSPWRSGLTSAAAWLKHNLTATTAPGAGDDSADGYAVGSLWIDTTADQAYICADPTAGAAVWVNMGGAAADAQYLTLAAHSGLSAERILTPGAGLSGVDGGAGAAYTLAVDINGQAADATPDGAADYVLTHDASAGGLKKVLLNNLPKSIVAKEKGSSIVAAATALDFKDMNVEDAGFGVAAVYKNNAQQPCGRLTLDSNNAVPTSDLTAQTTLHFVPYHGDKFQVWDGTRDIELTIPAGGISLSLSGYAANTNFDIFAYPDSGSLALDSEAWVAGVQTTFAEQSGYLVMSSDHTRRFVGTIRTTATAGQCEDSAGNLFVSNLYNQVLRRLYYTDTTSHSWASAAWRYWNNSSAHKCSFVLAQPQAIDLYVQSRMYSYSYAFLGIDATDGGTWADGIVQYNGNLAHVHAGSPQTFTLAAGYHTLTAHEYALGAPTAAYYDQIVLGGNIWG